MLKYHVRTDTVFTKKWFKNLCYRLPELVSELVDGQLLRHCQRLGGSLHNVVVAIGNSNILQHTGY